MTESSFLLQQSWFWLIGAAFLAVALAYFLYQKSTSSLSKNDRLFLAILRGLGFFVLLLLLLKPLLLKNEVEIIKPTLVLGIDDSKSMKVGGGQLEERITNIINSVEDALSSKFSIETRRMSDNSPIDTVSFTSKSTNIGSFFNSVNEEFAGENLAEVLFISDGIANEGYTPTSKSFPFRVNTIGVGDTTRKKDLVIQKVTNNQLAFLGNKFPIAVSIRASLAKGQKSTLRIKENDKIVVEQLVEFESNDSYQEFSFELEATEVGIQQYQIEILPISGEKTNINNYRRALIEVVDAKEKVLVLALNPHPDLKALKSITEKNELIETKILNVQTTDEREILQEDFDVLVLHQLPAFNKKASTLVTRMLSKGKPTLFILGALSQLQDFNGMQEVLAIGGNGKQVDLVTGSLNPSFDQFQLSDETNILLAKLPPISSPFGEYKVFPGTEVILFQKVGALQTDRPLLAFNETRARKAAVLTAEGLWKWRLEEYSQTKNQNLVDNLLLKTIQLLSLKEKKDKLRIYPTQNVFDTNDNILLQTEAYNSLLERVFNVPVQLTIKGPSAYTKEINYELLQESSTLQLDGLTEGVYSFEGRANILNKEEVAKGQFVIVNKDVESLNTRADFNLLRTLSANNNGDFIELNNVDSLIEKLRQVEAKGKVTSNVVRSEIINWQWLLAVLILLFTVEWVYRKYKGTY